MNRSILFLSVVLSVLCLPSCRDKSKDKQKNNKQASICEPGKCVNLDSGLKYKILKIGTNQREPKQGEKITVHYAGWLEDKTKQDSKGTKFDSSVDRGEKFKFTLGIGQVIKSYGNYLSEVTKGWLKLQGYYDLYNILKKRFGREHANNTLKSIWLGDIYMHDSTAIQVPYCWAYSTHFLIEKGNFWGQLQSLPPHRRRSFIDQVKEVTIEMAQSVAGAVAIGDLFVNYAYFVKKENIDISNPYHRKDIENDFQSLVHTLNKKLRPSHQSPFTNLSIIDNP